MEPRELLGEQRISCIPTEGLLSFGGGDTDGFELSECSEYSERSSCMCNTKWG